MRALLALALLATPAFADKLAAPRLVALAPDARHAIALGPAGEAYEPDGHGAWIRKHEGGVAAEIVSAVSAGTAVIAGTRGMVPFRFVDGAWASIYLGPHAKAIVGAGPRAVAAVGKTVFALDHAQPAKLADAPGPVLEVAASSSGVVAETDRGLVRLEGSAWKPVKGAPKHVAALLSDRWALVDHGALDLKTMKTTAWPAGLRVSTALAITADMVVAVASRGTALELVTLRAGKLDHEAIPLDHPAPVIGVAADPEGRVVVATRDGRLVVRERGTWTTAEVRDELPAARPGPPPAVSK